GIRDDLVTGVQTCALPISSADVAEVVPARQALDDEEAGRPEGLNLPRGQWQHRPCGIASNTPPPQGCEGLREKGPTVQTVACLSTECRRSARRGRRQEASRRPERISN